MSKKTTQKKKKINSTNLWAVIVSFIVIMGLICFVVGIIFIATMLTNKPTLNVSDFDQAESSIVYDSRGEEIANLGTVIRQNIEYDDIPNCVIDAFVAIEDSRYFEHNGFDVPRFTKAFLENIRTLSFGQGGSTFTMQLVKNTYFVNDETGENAARSGASGIRRKVQEIALAFELEEAKSKQDIFESYVNKLNFGGSNNIRGIQKASQYYFGKDLSEVNLVEGALLAGVINAPNFYNPFYNLDEAQERLTEVLYQMKNHGYITQAEYELAKSVRIEDLLNDPYTSTTEGEGIPYQAYIDQVVSECISITGLDPYTTTMHIYTYMNKDIQEEMDKIQAGKMDEEYLTFPDQYFECASVCIKNTTGEVVGIMGGRNYANGGQLLLNHATEQYKQPGSTIKPILDYALAFENLGWATDHVLTDRPMFYDTTDKIIVTNDSGTYVGDVTLKQALGNSINTCAIQTLQQVLDAKKYEYVVNYAQSLGYDFTLEDFNVQYAIGGTTCEVTPYQHAAAYAALMNYGLYTPPHTISRIEFTNGKSPITPKYTQTQILSEAASFLTAELMYSNVQNYGGSYSFVKTDDYPVYGKTGTTDFGTSGADFGIPNGAIKDGWLVAATSDYTTCTWVGYEKAVKGQQSYITKDYYYNDRPQGKIAHLILEAAYKYGGGNPTKLTQPSGVTSITHVIGTWPYAAYSEGMDPSLRTTGLIKSDAVKLVGLATPTVENMSSDIKVELDGTSGYLKLKWPTYPDESKLKEASNTKDISLKNSNGEVVVSASGTCLFSFSKLYGPIKYMADITISGNHNETIHISNDDNEASANLNISPGDKVHVEMYYAYESGDFKSNKVSADQSVTTSLYLPNSASELESWCSRYDFAHYSEVDASPGHEAGTFEIKDSNNATLIPGTTVTISNSGYQIYVTYYRKLNPTIKITPTTNGNNTATITASCTQSTFSGWNYDDEAAGLHFNTSTNDEKTYSELTISVDAGTTIDSYTVTAANNSGQSDSVTFRVQDGVISVIG